MKEVCILFCFIFCLSVAYSQQLELEVQGSLEFSGSIGTVDEAGLDFPENLDAESEVFLTVRTSDVLNKKNNPNNQWTIKIRKRTDIDIIARRTGAGNKIGKNGKANIQGGDNNQTLTVGEAFFFRGKGEVENIPVEIKLSQLSVTLGGRALNSGVIFTLYEGW